MITFRAPWSTTLKLMSLLVTIIIIAAVYGSLVAVREMLPPLVVAAYVAFPPLVLGGAYLFTIRGYQISPTQLTIDRPFMSRTYSLSKLKHVEIDPILMKGSIRLWGNGGLFSFSGFYRNARLGSYRAYVTDFDRAVALVFDGDTIVISPEEPNAFLNTLREYIFIGD